MTTEIIPDRNIDVNFKGPGPREPRKFLIFTADTFGLLQLPILIR